MNDTNTKIDRESAHLEYKVKVTDSFLKTVSAFANTGTGEIQFGVDDDRRIIGLSDPEKSRDTIERKINDSISPLPDYSATIDDLQKLVILKVQEGKDKPYYYGQTAYERKGASSIPMQMYRLEQMILNRDKRSYDTLPAPEEPYTFEKMSDEAIPKFGLEQFGKDARRTLGLENRNGQVTIAGALLADENSYPGIDLVAVNGEDLFGERVRIRNTSILNQLEESMTVFRRYFRKERIDGNLQRTEVYLVPEKAFREAVSNALVHRRWDLPGEIVIRFYEDRIEILSPGELPADISEDEYLNREISTPRNTTLANIFLRLGYIEHLGTGVRRIRRSYQGEYRQPEFVFTDHSIQIMLPVLGQQPELSEDERIVFDLLKEGSRSRSRIEKEAGFSRSKTAELLKTLQKKDVIEVVGGGRSTRYQLKDCFLK